MTYTILDPGCILIGYGTWIYIEIPMLDQYRILAVGSR